MPDRPATVADALPMLSGVVREPGGGLVISATPEHRNALIVELRGCHDPATGQIRVDRAIDSVEVLNVYQTPYLAEFGRFTSGLVSVRPNAAAKVELGAERSSAGILHSQLAHARAEDRHSPL